LAFGCSILAAAFGGRFLPPFLSRFAGFISLVFSGLVICFYVFFVRSVGFLFFLFPPLAGHFRLFFFRFQRDYVFDF